MGPPDLRLLPVLLFALVVPAASAASLQALIDATPAGGTLKLAAGSHVGPVSIAKPMTLDGGGRAGIVGSGRGTVLSVAANGVTLRGLHLRGSGESHDGVDAGILLEGDDHRVEDNVIEDVLFGIHLKRVNRSRVARNRVTGKPLDLGMRGDAIRLWYSQHNVIEANRFRRGRDLTFANSADNRIAGNHFVDGRYGMHVIFSPRLLIEDNRLSDTGTGIIVLYSPDLVLRGNHVAHALTGGGGGIVFKESHDALVEGNEVLHCSVGLRVDAPPDSVGKLTVRNNRFAHNIIGLFFTARRAAMPSSTTASRTTSPRSASARRRRQHQRLARQSLGRLPGLRPRPRRHRRHAARDLPVRRPHLDGNPDDHLLPQFAGAGNPGFPRAPRPLFLAALVLRDPAPRMP
ncbi:MAG: right-handed parallel beta-helix repeat-containing protein [Sulfuritalea sp.]|nr:right-handed parallel beta-helix repeat-containing protein [Sulfuritalea sp.]